MYRLLGAICHETCRLSLFLCLFMCGCESDKDGSTVLGVEGVPESSPADEETSLLLAKSAHTEVERVMVNLYDAEEIGLGELNFDEAEELYSRAIEIDSHNSEAQFGAALTHLLTLSSNTEVQATQDSLDKYLDINIGEFGIVGFNMGTTLHAIQRIPVVPAKMALGIMQDPLAVSDVQETVAAQIIPAINYALARLHIVENDPDFVFEVTPEMQGDEFEMRREIDLGEAFMLDAQLRLTKALLLVVIAYDFDFAEDGSYDFIDDNSDENVLRQLERLDKIGSFMTLRSDDYLQESKIEILEAITKINDGLATIRGEFDNQEDDIIRKGTVLDLDDEIDIDANDRSVPPLFRGISTFDAVLEKLRMVVEGSIEVEVNFNGDDLDEIVVINIGSFFDNPVRDLRALLPYHEWHLDLLSNDNFADELVLTDARGQLLGSSPPIVFPDPSFGGVLSNVQSNKQLLDLLGIENQDLNQRDLLYELGLIRYRGL